MSEESAAPTTIPSLRGAAGDPRGVAALVAGLAIVAAITALDAAWGSGRIVIGTLVVAPFVAALRATPRQTGAVALAAVAACAASGAWNDDFGSEDYLVRLAAVAGGGVIATGTARSRVVLFRDRVRFRLLSAAAAISDTTATIEETIQRLSDLLVPDLADICVIDVLRAGEIHRVAVAAHGPRADEIRDGLRRRARVAAQRAADGPVPAMRSGRAHLIERADDNVTRAAAHDDEDLRFLRSLAGRSSIIVPLRARARAIGSMALIVTAASGRSYTADDLEFAKVLSGRVALALDNAGLFTEVETLEAQQSAALGELAEAVIVQDAQGAVVSANAAAARMFGAAGPEELLGAAPRGIPDAVALFEPDGTPLADERLPARIVLAGADPEPVLVRSVGGATGEERWVVLKSTGVRDRSGQTRLAVTVIEDVTEVRRTELHGRFLAEAAELLASSLDTEATLAAVARLAVPQLADWCAVTVPDDRGWLRSVAVAHVDPERVRFAREYGERYPTRLGDGGGVARVIETGEAQVVNEIPDALLERSIADPEQLAALRSLGMRAVMIVPMTAPSGVIGAVTFVSAESGRTFAAADVGLAEELGRRAGTAIDNARLYTERSRTARTLQASLLPDELRIPGFDVACLYRPAGPETFVGGDFYDAVETPDGWMVLVGDVAGRGAEAAALTAQARHTVRTAGTLLGDPVAAIAQLNRALAQRRELSICTVAIVHVRERDGVTTAAVTCAGHPQPILVRDGAARPVGATGPMVGAWADSTWGVETFELRATDVLVLYTDGVTDAQGPDDRFGTDRLEAAVRAATGARGAVDAIRGALHAFERGDQADDTAVVAVRRAADPYGGEACGAPDVAGDAEPVQGRDYSPGGWRTT